MTENRKKLLCGIIGHRPLWGRCPPSKKEVKVEEEVEEEKEEEEDEEEDEMVLTK